MEAACASMDISAGYLRSAVGYIRAASMESINRSTYLLHARNMLALAEFWRDEARGELRGDDEHGGGAA